ncbi:MAG TPA: ABC transporter permease [Blastocatellia bacterium]|nr:ABC transporter permease [Blastocatellia bacterium]
MAILWQDLRYGLRTLAKNPGFTVVAVFTLALGIGANSAIFSVVNGVLLRPLPLEDPDRLIKIWETFLPSGQGTVSVPNLKDWREQNTVFNGIAAYTFSSLNLREQDSPERLQGATVTTNFFDVVGVRPRLGRAFQAGDDESGRNRVVLLSHQLWQRNFGGAAKVVGKEISLNGENYTVIGVMPPEFRFPSRLTELWVPLVFPTDQVNNRDNHWMFTLARLKPDIAFEQAREQMVSIAKRLEQQYPDSQAGRSVFLIPLQVETVRNIRPALMALLIAVGFVLLIACANVANLLLARAASRRREIAVRTALGAGRLRLVRQLLTESLMLAATGGALGLALAKWGVEALLVLASNFLPRANEVGLDWRVATFTAALSLLTGVFFGLIPALQSSRVDLQSALKEGAGAGGGIQTNWLRSALMVAEVAATLVLLVGAGLLTKSFIRLYETDLGFKAENVLTMSLALPQAKYPDAQAAAGFHQKLVERVASLPGARSASMINYLPLQQAGFNGGVTIEGQGPYEPGRQPLAEFRAISPDYFRTLSIPLISGRFFTAQDQGNSAPVVIVNQALAQRYLTGQDPIGKRIRVIGNDWRTIVGVVGDVRESGVTRAAMAGVFVPFTQAVYAPLTQTMSLAVRADAEPSALISAVRNAVREIDPAQPVFNVKTMETVVSDSVSDRRLNMLLLGIFASVALTLAVIGIYSVMSYAVSQHTREIGIRMALGARPIDVLNLVLGQGMGLTLVGVGVGVAGAFGLTRLMATLLYGVRPTDPLTFTVVSALLVIVALLACYVPARRATKVDPLVALRND